MGKTTCGIGSQAFLPQPEHLKQYVSRGQIANLQKPPHEDGSRQPI